MVPVRLSMRNFLCYRDNCPPLDFTGIALACLSGENGHGKSALLDAVTWAVWGQARAKTDDELIHMGRVDMEVEFDFHVGEVVYRVLRKRRKGTANGPGRTLLEFQVLSAGEWKPLTGNTVRDTQARIIEAVRLDYDTFRNSAFIMQGRADEFTLKAPGERKRVLAEILGLSAYDGYEAKARDERKRWEADVRRLDAVIAQYTVELQREAQYERERRETVEELGVVEKDLGESRARLTALQDAERTLQLLRSQAEAAERDRQQALDRVQRSEEELKRQRAIVERFRVIVGREGEIRARYAALIGARAAESEQSSRLARVAALRRDEAKAQAAVDREAATLHARRDLLRADIERLGLLAVRQPEIEQALTAVAGERAAVEQGERRLADLRRDLQEETNASGQLQAVNKRHREDMDELKHKQGELTRGDGAICPICRTALGEAGTQRIFETYEAEGKQLAAEFRNNKAMQEAVKARCLGIQESIKHGEEEAGRARTAVERKQASLERDRREAVEASAAVLPLTAERRSIEASLQSEAFAAAARSSLREISESIAAAGYDEAAHQQARSQTQALAGADAEHSELQLAEESSRNATASIARTEEDLAEWCASVEKAEERKTAVELLLAGQADPREDLVRVSGTVTSLEQAERRLRLALGAAEQKLDDCRRYRRAHDAAQIERTAARRRQQIYDDLATAFGRKGVQALIIDSVLSEIEEEASSLLARMSNGRMSVTLTTQKETQRGTPVETLDISIADELGTRAYEMFSGGEAFRINLALRIALSKLLARRAGAPLPTLIVDEGFGTQDASGRERVMEALNAVARDFECLIVITHIDELRDQFDRQIKVEKRPEGSFAWIE